MPSFEIEITSPDAEADARALAQQLASAARTTVTPQPAVRGLDAVAIIGVTAAVQQSNDIIYRYWQDFRAKHRARGGSHPALTIVLPDGTRILLADTDLENARLIVEAHQ